MYKNSEKEYKDEEILALSVKRPSVFGLLIDRYQEAFLRKAFTIVRHTEEAEDIVQEAFTKIYVNAEKFKKVEGASFKSWAYKILINTSYTHYNKLKRIRETFEYVDLEFYEKFEGARVGNVEADIDEQIFASKLLKGMPKHFHSVVKKYYLEDKSQKQIAEEEGTSVAAIKMRIFRAKGFLKKVIKENKIQFQDDALLNVKIEN